MVNFSSFDQVSLLLLLPVSSSSHEFIEGLSCLTLKHPGEDQEPVR